MFKSSRPGALDIVEQTLQLDPRLMGHGVGFQDSKAEVVGNGLINPLENMGVNFLPSNIAASVFAGGAVPSTWWRTL